ncbi:MAG: radical SAM protein [Candidatus Glassbacteria bacterium]|nr:radical SAM protein [Candidatus Glassbacteria bacterium]
MRILLLTPPMTNLTSPYPATAYLAGYLGSIGVEVDQADWSLELACRLFSREGLERLHASVKSCASANRARKRPFVKNYASYRDTVDEVVGFLQGKNEKFEQRILSGRFLPEGRYLRQLFLGSKAASWAPRNLDDLEDHDRARVMASLYLLDLSEVVDLVNPGFKINSYAKMAASSSRFDDLLTVLEGEEGNLLHELVREMTVEGLHRYRPDVVGLSVPFPGSVAGALLIARAIRNLAPAVKVVMGGGYVNTYLRKLTDHRVFDYVDYITLDDGARPLACLLQFLAGKRGDDGLLRTYLSKGETVIYQSSPDEKDIPFAESATPVYSGLPLDSYLALLFSTNPAERRVWSRRWNSLILAHGCYWGKCAFCDTSLDYIKRYEPQRVDRLVEQIEDIASETRLDGFHFVDEAAPPSLLRSLSRRLLEKRTAISWWVNIRFERAFTPELARLMAEAGCIRVTAGLEVASDRLLGKMNKGVSVAQVARVARRFVDNGLLVHAYLMYGFPSETVQETIDSLEMVRQLFAAGCLHSAHWHRFEATEHSPIGRNPQEYGIELVEPDGEDEKVFGVFRRKHKDPAGIDHEAFGKGLWDALYAYQEQRYLERDVREWFEFTVPGTTVPKDYIENVLSGQEPVRLPPKTNPQ